MGKLGWKSVVVVFKYYLFFIGRSCVTVISFLKSAGFTFSDIYRKLERLKRVFDCLNQY